MTSNRDGNWGQPHIPESPPLRVDGLPLSSIRDIVTNMAPDLAVEQAITSVMDKWRTDPRAIEPITLLRETLNSLRFFPRGEARLSAMNTFVRTLGQPQTLATLLEMMRDSAGRDGTHEEELTRPSRQGTRHAVYGWAGQTLLLLSDFGQSAEMVLPEPAILEMMGETETPGLWALSMHIWQPNPSAESFPTGARIDPGTIVEPPHSHPFDFSSMVSAGVMHQSTYAHRQAVGGAPAGGRYDEVRLEHVDGVWPEHVYRSSCDLVTLESGVRLSAGDSYFLSTDVIHDVQIDQKIAAATPAITLFLASEAVVVSHTYMSRSMADAHDADPDLKNRGRALSERAWQEKLRAAAAYLRGEAESLSLGDIVQHQHSYAFFHKS